MSTPPAPTPRPRCDSLPEHHVYLDTGCRFARSCIQCPLHRCVHDLPFGARDLRMHHLELEGARLLQLGYTDKDVAHRLRISLSSFYRLKRRLRRAAPDHLY